MEKMRSPWSSLTVAGRGIEIFQPAPQPSAALLWLHDLDEVSFQGREGMETALATEGLVVVCPAGGRGWWLDRPAESFDPPLTPLRYLREVVLPWIEQQWGLAPPRVGVAGLGMGGQGAVNLAFRHPRQFPVVAGILPDIDFHQWHGAGLPLDRLFPSREAARQETATLHLHPLNWPRHLLLCCDPADVRFEGTERLASKLYSSGIPFEADFETRGDGTAWGYCERVIPRVARFLGEHLRGGLPVA
jgi:S-formylglutathione hydrolase